MSKIIANTKRNGLSVARVDRNRIDALYYQLIDLLKGGHLGAEYEHFFAKPLDVASEKSIDWYTELNGDAIPLPALAGEEYSRAVEKFADLLSHLKSYAETLRQSGERSSAELIKNALNVPDESYVYVVNGAIVVTCWGFSNAENSLVRDGDIMGLVKEKRKAPDAANRQQVAAPVAPSTPTADMGGEQAQAVPPPPAPDASGRSWLLPVLIGALLVLAGAFAAWYFLFKGKDEPTPPASVDMSFLQGTHKASGQLVNDKGEPVDLLLVFEGADGKGKSLVKSQRQQCTGTVSARFGQGDKVLMDLSPLTCPDSNNFEEAFTVECDASMNACTGIDVRGTRFNINITKEQ